MCHEKTHVPQYPCTGVTGSETTYRGGAVLDITWERLHQLTFQSISGHILVTNSIQKLVGQALSELQSTSPST